VFALLIGGVILPADYSEGKPLKMALLNYVKMICNKIEKEQKQ